MRTRIRPRPMSGLKSANSIPHSISGLERWEKSRSHFQSAREVFRQAFPWTRTSSPVGQSDESTLTRPKTQSLGDNGQHITFRLPEFTPVTAMQCHRNAFVSLTQFVIGYGQRLVNRARLISGGAQVSTGFRGKGVASRGSRSSPSLIRPRTNNKRRRTRPGRLI